MTIDFILSLPSKVQSASNSSRIESRAPLEMLTSASDVAGMVTGPRFLPGPNLAHQNIQTIEAIDSEVLKSVKSLFFT